ncbi:hypothetical protein L218DRAFT_967056, partial [Marasmius fiardii PR-910]
MSGVVGEIKYYEINNTYESGDRNKNHGYKDNGHGTRLTRTDEIERGKDKSYQMTRSESAPARGVGSLTTRLICAFNKVFTCKSVFSFPLNVLNEFMEGRLAVNCHTRPAVKDSNKTKGVSEL